MSILHLFDRLDTLGIKLKSVNGQLKIEAPKGTLTQDLISELQEKKEEISVFLQKHGQKQEKYTAIEPAEKQEYYPLSCAQKRLYFLQQIDPRSTAYNMALALNIGKEIDKSIFASALKKLITRHESLRTCFIKINDVPVQRVYDPEEIHFEMEYYDLATEVTENTEKTLIRPFDLTRAPLVRSVIVKSSTNNYTWVLDIHHIISDGTSHMILAEDFMAFYAHEETVLNPLKLQYKDYSQWQNRVIESGKHKDQEDYWLKLYGDAAEIPQLNLPTDYERPAVFTFAGSHYGFTLTKEVSQGFKAQVGRYGGTLYMNFLAALNTLFYKYSGQTDIIIGVGVADRPHADLQRIIGMFVNTLGMRNYPQGARPYDSFLKEVIQNSLESFENQDVQFEELVDRLGIRRDPSRNPLFDISMVVQSFRPILGFIDDKLPSAELINPTSKFDMTFFIEEQGADIFINIEFYTGIFKVETIERLAGHFKNIIEAVVANPGIKLKDIDIISLTEKEQILYRFNDTAGEYPVDKTAHKLFQEQVFKTPDHISLVGANRHLGAWPASSVRPVSPVRPVQLTYLQLDKQSNQLAQYLFQVKNLRPDDRVGILMDKTIDSITAIFGILKAGGAYVPLEPTLPLERMKYIIDDAGIGIVISQGKYTGILNRLQWECPFFHTFLCLDSVDIYNEGQNEKSGLMDEKLWDYVAETAADKITGGGWTSSYTSEPFSSEEMEEYGNNILSKLEPYLHPGARVLEIGCASGISMYRIAPRVALYYGTDLSRGMIEKNKRQVEKEGHKNIRLMALAAHEIDQVDEQNFDLIIINSVIQAFPDHNYLRRAVKKCLDLLGEKGYLFIGDVMDNDLKGSLLKEMNRFKENHWGQANIKTKTDFSQELFVSRAFFEDLRFEMPGIQRLEFTRKIHTIENELTKFRYDALITIDKTKENNNREAAGRARHKHQEDLRALMACGTGDFSQGVQVLPGNLAYVIYTSGTTGRPKGVMIEHRGMANLKTFFETALKVEESDRVLQFAKFSFDASVWEIFMALFSGALLYLTPEEVAGNYNEFEKFIERHQITVATLPPPYLIYLNPRNINSLKRLITAGSETNPVLVDTWRLKLDYINAYGPTETTICATCWHAPAGSGEFVYQSVPIGKPILNTGVYILAAYDREQVQPLGVPGELCIAGVSLARGYLNNPELTAEKFLNNHRSYGSNRTYTLYKTGDLTRWLIDGPPAGGATKGIIEFLGRIDQQVKIRGFRIELGEIENRLVKCPDIRDAVVIAKSDENGDKYLCAYFVSGKKLENSELREALAKDLPDYMIPAYFMRLDKMPLNTSGKINRKALPEPGKEKNNNYLVPRDEIEKQLLTLWLEILGKDRLIGITDNFFEVGGHSLRATMLTSRIQKELNVKVPLAEVFKSPTIEELARYIRAAVKETYLAIEPAEKKEYYPLSSAQGRFYILQEVTPESTAYNMTAAYEVEGSLVKERFETSLRVLINRHAIFRTSFQIINGKPVQRVYDEVETNVFAELFSKSDPPEAIIKSFIRPFDLTKAPLLRVSLLELSLDRHIFLFDMHHIVFDGTSMSIFLAEFMTLYAGGKLSPLKLHYHDFAQWQYNQLTTGRLEKQRQYWLQRFPGELPVLNMPTDFPRPPIQRFDGDKLAFKLEKNITSALKKVSQETGATLYMALLTIYNIILARYTGQEDIIIGTTVAGRYNPDLQGIMGLLIETLVQRNYPMGHLAFKTFLEMVKNETLETHENQAYPFREIIRMVGADNEVSRNPVFDVMLIVQNFESTEFHLEGLKFSSYLPGEEDIHKTSKVDITIEASEDQDSGEIYFTLEYCTCLYKRETMERFARHFLNITAQATANPLIPLAAIEVMNEAEKKQLLETFNDTTHKSSKEIPRIVVARFQDQADREPDRIAIVGLGQFVNSTVYLTYRGLSESADNLAARLIEQGVRTETIVALMIESSIEMAVAIWGILKAGGAYLPIEPGAPKERVDYMLKDSGAILLAIANDQEGEKLRSSEVERRGLQHSKLAYIIYTSGTSGHPKGVMVEHGNLANYVVAVTNEIGLREDDTVLQQGSLVFDAFVEEFYPLLVIGGKVAIPGKMITRDIPALCQFIARHHVSMIASAPQMVNELNKALRDGLPGALNAHELLSSMRIVLVGGDRVKTDYIDKFMEQADVYNTYGPTESTVCATYYKCNEAPGLSGDVPIGKPLAEYKIYIEDRYGGLAPIGVGGELCVGGPGVTRGYMNQVELTHEKYVLRRPGALPLVLYHTGDLARWLSDGPPAGGATKGIIEFLGRIDRQVKIRGYRIELAEIETLLISLPNIKEAVVIDEARKSGDKYLAAYVVSKETFAAGEIKGQLAVQLPDYMIPTYIIKVEQIPWTSIGKVDRKRLPSPQDVIDPQQSYNAPRNDTEKRLAEIWQQILEKDCVGIDDNFFDIGGTSLDIIKLNTRIKEEFNKQIPVVSLFQYTTIRTLTQLLEEERSGSISQEKQKEGIILDAIKRGQAKFKGRIPPETGRTGLEIAVIGMSGIFPGARNLEEFWENLKNGIESIHFFSNEELLEDGVEATALENPNYIKAKGIIAGVEYFDASFFGYTPLEAQIMDPQIRIFQQTAWHALEDAGYDPFAYNRRIGLYAGASPNYYWAALTLFSGMGRNVSGFMAAQLADKDFMCTHTSYKLNLKGPSVSLQTACSTSLVAIHYAVQGLLHGECEMALAGGVSVSYPNKRGYIYQPGMIFSSDGHNRSFDARADGSIFGDGVGVVVLKSLADAISDRDHIYALIKGSAINNDGLRKVGYTAPSIQGQMEVIHAAQSMAEVEPERITYIEAHGTATPLGDSVEIEALKQAFNTDKKRFCAIGTLKSNMGHLYSAAGTASFIKTVLALNHRLIPPSLYFESPNPQIDFQNSPFYVNATLQAWHNDQYPLRAGVSSFGIGGTNAHIVLEEWLEKEGRAERTERKEREEKKLKLLLISARAPSALNKMTDNLVRYLKENPPPHLADIAYTLQVGRKHFAYRRMMVSPDLEPGQDFGQLMQMAQRAPIVQAKEENRPIIFMFCGQGSQYEGMGIDLYRTEPVFRRELDQCFETLNLLMGHDVKEALYPSESNRSSGSYRTHILDQTEIAQPVLFTFEYALAKLLMSWGIQPTAMIGYSFGEYVAACLAGVFSPAEVLDMIVTRGKFVQQTPPGKMSSVTLPEHELKPLLTKGVSIAIVNGPTCIVSGKKEDVEAFEKEMKQKRMICVPLNMSHAVHSAVMNPIRGAFEQKISRFHLNKPRIPFISNVTAQWVTGGEVATPAYWGDHLCSTVRFSDGLSELLKQENAIFIEIGPGRILGMMIRVHTGKKPGHLIINTVKHPQERVADDYFILEKLGQLWQQGQVIDWAGFYGDEKRKRVSLPGYPFEGKRYWIDPKDIAFGGGMAVSVQTPGASPVEQEFSGSTPRTPQTNGEIMAPRSEVEQLIARLWKEFMGLAHVGIYDDFFQLNGSSLVATQIIARLMQEYNIEIPINAFYEQPTIAHLAEVIENLKK